MKYPKVVKASGSNEVLAVIENLPVSANGYFLDETQMSGIESTLTQAETDATALVTANENATTLQAQITALTGERDTAQASLKTANESLATMTSDRDNWKVKAEEFGGTAELPNQTEKQKDPATGGGGPKKLNSMDAYAAKHGIDRVKA